VPAQESWGRGHLVLDEAGALLESRWCSMWSKTNWGEKENKGERVNQGSLRTGNAILEASLYSK